ncbi:MutS-related protein [Flavobacteriaceae bacterium M23B6Z8]
MNYSTNESEHLKSPYDYYESRIALLEKETAVKKKKLLNLSFLRLLVFVVSGFASYWLYDGILSLTYTLLPGLIIFLWLISKYSDSKYLYEKHLRLIEINKTELQVLDKDFKGLEDGSEFLDSAHEFARDIDLFGEGSFFQYINRTALNEGKEKLANVLMANKTDQILAKQEAVKTLAGMPEWRQEYLAVASLIKAETSSRAVLSWLEKHKRFTPSYARLLSLVFSAVSLGLCIVTISGFLNERILLVWFLIGLGITGRYFKKVNKLSDHTSRVQSTFDQYHQLLGLLENKQFNSSLLDQKLKTIQKGALKSSWVLKKFSKAIDALDQRNNMIFGILANGFLLWDLYQSNRIENWIHKYEGEVERWFELVCFFDAQISLANFVFNHPLYTFPEISDDAQLIKALEASHPLLDSEKSVKNSFEVKEGAFFIITGANMAGKSTFLRTVSLLIVMANTGLPVCADFMRYRPVQLITSMRTSDSLANEESYFFSELKRLKFIVDTIKNENYFVVLDEILKGTNSTDKANGSKKFIEKLVAAKVTGIVATHDLSLCVLEEKLDAVENYYFDAEIIDDELHFDYLLKEGVCKNMNASFLLKKMEIV